MLSSYECAVLRYMPASWERALEVGFGDGAFMRHVALRAGAVCFAEEYRDGAESLLFLRGAPASLSVYWSPLAPVNEQLWRGDDA